MLYNNILETIGNTPHVRLNHIGQNLACTLFVKCEFFNPGGSIKDRIAYNMVTAAEAKGTIKPGDTLIEPSSGNTGIGIALAGAVKGYNVIITMPEKMSHEKQVVLEALGATIYRTPTEVTIDDPDSHISLAKRLHQQTPNSHVLDQYSNSANPDAHYHSTAAEIIADFGKDLAMVIMGVGTGGTITGVAKRLKEFNPEIKIIGVDPIGSILGGGTEAKPYEVEGIGYDFFPKVLDNSLVDQYIKVSDQDSLQMARRLVREEGLLCGGSCGSAVVGALQATQNLQQGQRALIILPDSIRNYLTKHVDNGWMQSHGFLAESSNDSQTKSKS